MEIPEAGGPGEPVRTRTCELPREGELKRVSHCGNRDPVSTRAAETQATGGELSPDLENSPAVGMVLSPGWEEAGHGPEEKEELHVAEAQATQSNCDRLQLC